MPSSSDAFSSQNLRLKTSKTGQQRAVPGRSRRPPRHRPGEWFLRGPVPWPWLEAAAALPGQALALSLCLWREVGRAHKRTVKVRLGHQGLGLSEYAARRAMKLLEKAGLVSLQRHPGKGIEVTLLDLAGAEAKAMTP